MTNTATLHTLRAQRMALALGVLSLVWAGALLLSSLLHAGITVNLGIIVLEEATILPAQIVETVSGLALAVGGLTVLTRRSWAWTAATTGHAVALVGVTQGILVTTFRDGTSSVRNDIFHWVMVVVLVSGLLALTRPSVRAAIEDRSDPHRAET
ncbi:MAG TPA: hypothetical protein VHF25_09905 [Nitriliruptorales bacterium]|nr:hypothetical protein [Nitriliruptorales bacterium]